MSASSNITKMTEKEQKALLQELLAKKEKAAATAKAYREANKDKAKAWSERARVRQVLMVAKAKEAGLSVSEAEVDAYLSKLVAGAIA